jgi:DNA-binding transcriptional ArsR family regulator
MTRPDDKLYRMKAEIIKAAAHPIRLAVIDCLRGGERCVCEITEEVGAERSNISRHLALMTRSGLLDSRKDGLMVFYRLRTPCVVRFIDCVGECLKEQIKENNAVLKNL